VTATGPTHYQRNAMLKALLFCFGDANGADAEMVIEAIEKYGFVLTPKSPKDQNVQSTGA